MVRPSAIPCPARRATAALARRTAILLAAAVTLLAAQTAQARNPTQVYILGLDYRSSHGCSQSFASTSFRGSLVLTLMGQTATLVLAGKHHYSMGPSPGRFRQSGGKDQTHHTFSTMKLSFKGTARHRGGALVLELTQDKPQCKTESGYYHTTAFACTAPATLSLACAPAQVPVYRATRTPGTGAYPDKTERPTQVKALRCVPSGKNLGLLEQLLFDSGLTMTTGAGLVHHHGGMSFRRQSALRFPGKQP